MVRFAKKNIIRTLLTRGIRWQLNKTWKHFEEHPQNGVNGQHDPSRPRYPLGTIFDSEFDRKELA